ncbi:MAG: electron transport complex subunit RsxC [Clostridiales bacterium]|mgnify:CR=1 FL=1|nr:MAG: electron transport complex subunit RsxC [Clostridiales bacterium]
MNLLSFRGGIHPPHSKEMTEHLPVEKALEPEIVVIPLQQHIGAPCKAIVEVGEKVKVGQKIGEAGGFVSAPVHSSISGTVKKIEKRMIINGTGTCIVIESDGLNEVHESVVPKGDVETLEPKEILDIINEAGIVGMGGAGFPTRVKLSPPPDKKIDVLILNGAECEPYLTSDHRLMLETPEDVVYGLRAVMRVLGLEKAYIAIENNKMDAVLSMKEAAKEFTGIQVVVVKTKYPQGSEKQLIYACSQREVPSGALPMDAGAVVSNVATMSAISKAIRTGMPLIERICTVTGDGIVEPKNIMIKNGTRISEIIAQAGGYKGEPGKLILGGPMMGFAQFTDDLPSTKTTSGVLVFTEEQARLPEPNPCIRCGKCVDICPSFIQPFAISAYSLNGMFDMAEKNNAMDCIECGSCSFICPSKRPLLHSIRMAKREILSKRRKTK